MEVALRIVEQYWRLQGENRTRFVAFRGGYHGDTAGAAALGAADMFNGPSGWAFPATKVSSVEELEAFSTADTAGVGAVVMEPLIQGAAGMRLWPKGTLAAVRQWCDRTGTLLIADEVMTGFGRTGRMFACEHEAVIPDLMILGKALTGGYVPLSLTVISESIIEPFLRSPRDKTTLFYGHSYSGNAIGCAAAKASLELFTSEQTLTSLQPKIELLTRELAELQQLPQVREVRQCGFIAGLEITTEGYHPQHPVTELGAAICVAARKHGLLTRPIRNTIVLMPPYCITEAQLQQAVSAIRTAILEVVPGMGPGPGPGPGSARL
jgi:adenosylmethionine-8-amino-7-oxononanoate aminotransferase